MKKFLSFLLCVCFSGGMLGLSCHAGEKEYSWYCVHVKDHVQPSVGGDISFVEELDGYYIDHSHKTVDDEDKVVYLTFDAGYENGNVEKILDVMKEEQVTGAFFILGSLITKHPELVKRMAEEGHTVCNHTVRHKNMSGKSDAEFLAELQELERIYKEQTGYEMAKYYRPPEGRFSKKNLECAKKNGYKTVFWSFAYPDWDNNKQMSPEKAKQIILENTHNGEVMLLHPTSSTNAEILSDVIRALKAEGYRFGNLDELTGKAAASCAEQPLVYRSAQTDTMKIALTFDDGPHPYLTPQILDILQRYQIHATFFMVGVNVMNYPETARAVISSGHEVGNHTFSHHHIPNMRQEDIAEEIERCEDALEELCEYRPHLFRPPQGAVNRFVERCAEEGDYTLILWSLDTRDWECKSTEQIVDEVISKVQPGDIILMHDYIGKNSKTPEALEILLPKLLERGFEPTTVSSLLGLQ